MEAEPLLQPQDHAFLREHGYVVLPQVVPPENLRAVVDLIWTFLEMDPHDPDDWYRPPHQVGGMVEVYQHQALWDNRQHPRVYRAFRDILGTGRLWVSLDRVSMKPPRHPAHPEWDHCGVLHWDVDTRKLPHIPFGLQGVLCLTDTAADQGGFQCVPGMHRGLEEWIKTQPRSRNPRVPDLTGRTVVPVPALAGDLIIWDRLLPHGNGRNTSDRPRLAQYLHMFPAAELDERQRRRRVRQWERRQPPPGRAFPGDPRKKERREHRTAELTELGRRLLGLETWPADIT